MDEITPKAPEEQSTAVITDQQAEQSNQQPQNMARSTSWFARHKKILFPLALVLLAVVAAGAYVLTQRTNDTPKQSTKQTSQTDEQATGNKFLDKPQKLGDLSFYKNPEEVFGETCEGEINCKPAVHASDIEYYKIGTTANNQSIIIVYVNSSWAEDIGDTRYVALQTGENQYSVLLQHDSRYNSSTAYSTAAEIDQQRKDLVSGFREDFNANVSLDTKTVVSELAFPETITVRGVKLSTQPESSPSSKALWAFVPEGFQAATKANAPDSKVTKVDTVSGKDVYLVSSKSGTANKESFIVAYKGYITTGYTNIDPLVATGSYDKDGKPQPDSVTWTSGAQNKADYVSSHLGCGSDPNAYITTDADKSSLTVVGKDAAGRSLYSLPSSSPLVTEAYDEYKVSADGDFIDKSLRSLSLAQYQDQHGLVLLENPFGGFIVSYRADLVIQGGCGKPVVYLYPTQQTSVDVRVGADVTVSVPQYETSGWQDVLAHPDGKLIYRGQQYDSLFWEGFGHGQYPFVTSGVVVARKDAPTTICRQLAEQGLNAKEINDFMAFWESRLPSNPYVRLSWLTKAEMDTLAPLHISPLPDTTIRVFLDFEGLDQPMQLPAQTLRAPKRIGFTAVEWGGLLRDGSVPVRR